MSRDDAPTMADEETGRGTPTAGRRQWILQRLQEQEFVAVKELADQFEMTEMSLRRDLNALADKGLLVRVRGGARRARAATMSPRYADAEQRNPQAKAQIARAASEMLEHEKVVFFYSGSTVARVAAAISPAQRAVMTAVTPSLPVVNEVSSWADPHLVVVGGLFLPDYQVFVGPQAVQDLDALSADVAVVGCDGITAEEGLTTPHHLVAEIGTLLVARARKTIVVADSSKIGRRGFTAIAPIADVHTVITDAAADPHELKALRDCGIQVVVAKG
ncbi:DeoR/GlpR family DNA-binding transcription regulator [Oryzobacter terrae]|uniref:DeoR/GlpR family DNA-binding transcription regulator n=1 Tax=Oryzobacter terrae TaxID=1620385 RepID=UPI00366D160F